MLPNPPHEVSSSQVGAFQLQLNWLRPEDASRQHVDEYVISYRELKGPEGPDGSEGSEGPEVPDGRYTRFELRTQPDPGRPLDPVATCDHVGGCSFVIKNLKAYTTYQFKVASKSALAVSSDSAPYQARTLMFGTRCSLLDIFIDLSFYPPFIL